MGPEAQFLQAAVNECPDWLKPRISNLARNLCLLHRIEKTPVSEKTARTMLVAMGFMLAKVIFDHAKAGVAELEAKAARELINQSPELLEELRAICPHAEFIPHKGERGGMECSACGMHWVDVNGGAKCKPAPAREPWIDPAKDPELTEGEKSNG